MYRFGFTLLTGPVELDVSSLQSETNRRVICVDLGSVFKKQRGDHFYRLEKADVTERNKWELTFTIELISGLTASANSRPFRVTTKANYKRRSAGDWTILPSQLTPLSLSLSDRHCDGAKRGRNFFNKCTLLCCSHIYNRTDCEKRSH